MKFMAFSCRHPIDAALYIKSGQKVSTFSAVVVGILGVLVYLFDYVYRGFIFNHNSLRYTQYTVVLATVVIPGSALPISHKRPALATQSELPPREKQ